MQQYKKYGAKTTIADAATKPIFTLTFPLIAHESGHKPIAVFAVQWTDETQ